MTMKLLRVFLRLFLKVLPLAVAMAVVLIYMPEPLDDIAGRGTQGAASVELLERARAAVAAGRVFECTEAELNQHVRSVLEAREGTGFDILAEFGGLWVRLNEGSFDLVFEREVLGFPSTVSAELRIVRVGEVWRIEPVGGRFGRLPVPPQLLWLIAGGLENAGRVFAPEKEVLSRSYGVTISAGRLRLDPPLRAGSP